MRIDFSKFFHRASKDLSDKGTVRIPNNDSNWPSEWKTTFYKSYGTLPKIHLPSTQEKNPLFNLIERRKSRRNAATSALNLNELSSILKYSCGEIDGVHESGQRRRAHPSAGGRYPVEVYVLIFQDSPELTEGVYHYNVKNHALTSVWKKKFEANEIRNLFSYNWIQKASAVIVMTGVFDRTARKYGSHRGYRFLLLEAGHIAQNLYLTSESLNIGCCAMTGMHEEEIEKILEIDGVTESVVYSVVLSK